MEMKDKAMNIAALGILLLAVAPHFLITSNSNLNDLFNTWYSLLVIVIIGIAILLYGIMFLGVALPEKICDIIAGIGVILASLILIIAPLLNQFLK